MYQDVLRLPELTRKTGLSRSTIYSMIKEGNFPKQIKLGKRSSGWVMAEIEQWIDQRVSARDEVGV